MRLLVLLGFILFLKACGLPAPKNKNVIGPKDIETQNTITIPKTDPVKSAPKDAVFGNYNGGNNSFYGHIRTVDKRNGIMVIAFEQKSLPLITINNVYGRSLSSLKLQGFDRDLLLVTSKLKDPSFNKYFVYMLRNNQWKQVVNGFAVHQSHFSQLTQPILNDPGNSNNLKRYYSVFDLDATSATGDTWRLLSENIPIENR